MRNDDYPGNTRVVCALALFAFVPNLFEYFVPPHPSLAMPLMFLKELLFFVCLCFFPSDFIFLKGGSQAGGMSERVRHSFCLIPFFCFYFGSPVRTERSDMLYQILEQCEESPHN